MGVERAPPNSVYHAPPSRRRKHLADWPPVIGHKSVCRAVCPALWLADACERTAGNNHEEIVGLKCCVVTHMGLIRWSIR